jgi:hypothetical protein
MYNELEVFHHFSLVSQTSLMIDVELDGYRLTFTRMIIMVHIVHLFYTYNTRRYMVCSNVV